MGTQEQVTVAKFKRILEKNGFQYHRNGKGDHIVYIDKRGRKIAFPVKNKEVNPMLYRGIVRRYELDEN